MHVIVAEVADARYAVEVDRLVEVLPRVRITPLGGAPSFVEGMFVYRERPCVAVSLRARFGHPSKAASLEDHMLVVEGRTRRLALLADRVLGDAHLENARLEPSPAAGARVKGVIALGDGVLLLQDLDALLSAEEDADIARCLEEAAGR